MKKSVLILIFFVSGGSIFGQGVAAKPVGVCEALLSPPRSSAHFKLENIQVSTGRLLIRVLAPSDISAYVEILKGGEIKQMANDRAWQNMPANEMHENFFESLGDSHDSSGGSYGLSNVDQASQAPIGFLYVPVNENSSQSAEGAYDILPKFWGQDVASEALGAILPLAKQFGLRQQVAVVASSNVGSQRVLQKNSFDLLRTENSEDLREHLR